MPGSRLGKEGPQDRTEKTSEGDTEQQSVPGRRASTVTVWWPGQTNLGPPPGLGNSEQPLSQSSGSRNPTTTKRKGQRKTHGRVDALSSESLFAELLFPDEVFTNQPFRVWFLGGWAESP